MSTPLVEGICTNPVGPSRLPMANRRCAILCIERAVNLRVEAISITSDTLKPSRLGNIARQIFYMGGMSILGAACGCYLGGLKFRREDKQREARIVLALNRYRVDVFRKQADDLERKLRDSDSTES